MRRLAKIKPLHNAEITQLFTDIGKSCHSREFLRIANLVKISGFTVYKGSTLCKLGNFSRFLSSVDIFQHFFENIFSGITSEFHVKQFGSRSGTTFCQA